MLKNHMVAVCDILGFSNYIQNLKSAEDYIHIFDDFHKSLLHSIRKKEFPTDAPPLKDFKSQNILGIRWFSDTVLLYTLNDKDEDCRILINTIAWLIFENIYSRHTKIRAGISYGEVHIDEENGIYVGKPIVQAAKLEKNQMWSGAALSKEAISRIPRHVLVGSKFNWHLVRYNIPMKSKEITSEYAVDWTIGDHQNFNYLLTDNPNMVIEDSIRKKWENTIAFHSDVCFWCNMNNSQKVDRC